MAGFREWITTWQKPFWVLAVVISFGFYFIVGGWQSDHHIQGKELWIWIDHAIPFWPRWEFIYITVYVFAFLPAFTIKDNALYQRVALALVLALMSCNLVFFLFPTEIPKPQLADSGFTAYAIRLNHYIDVTHNCFPSMHVCTAFTSAYGAYAADRTVGAIALVWAALIAASTLLVKHHFFLDVVGGVILSIIACAWLIRPMLKRDVPVQQLRRHRAFALIPPGMVAFAIIGGYFFLYLGNYKPWLQ